MSDLDHANIGVDIESSVAEAEIDNAFASLEGVPIPPTYSLPNSPSSPDPPPFPGMDPGDADIAYGDSLPPQPPFPPAPPPLPEAYAPESKGEEPESPPPPDAPPITPPITQSAGRSPDTPLMSGAYHGDQETNGGSELSVPASMGSRSPVLPISSSVARMGKMGGNPSPSLASYDDFQDQENHAKSLTHPEVAPGVNGDIPHDEDAMEMIEPVSPANDGYSHPANTMPAFDPSVDTPAAMATSGAGIDIESKGQTQEVKETLYFSDGRRRIDFVLAYKDLEDEMKEAKRSMYEFNLDLEGLQLETEPKANSIDGETYYTKIHAPFDALLRGCELLGMKKRIKMPKNLEDKLKGTTCCRPFEAGEDIIPEEDDYFTMPFSQQRMEMFDIGDPDTFFTNAERTLIVKEMLDRTSYTAKQNSDIVRFGHKTKCVQFGKDKVKREDSDDEQEVKYGIRGLLNGNIYIGAFPLHEGPYDIKGKASGDEANALYEGADKDRARLYEAWARPGRFMCYQPLDLIRKYFGEKIAIYFAWLGFYTQMLIPAAIFGILAFLYGLVTLLLELDVPSNDVCDSNGPGNFTMCPLCDKRCTFWKLEESCLYSKLSYLFDNYATVAYAAFMAIWATLFLEFWKRKQKELEYDWDVADFELEERMRPEYEFKVQRKKENPITRIQEPYLAWYSRGARTCTSCTVICFMILLVVAAIFAVVLYRIIIVSLFYVVEAEIVSEYAKLWTSFTAAAINVVAIMILNIIYRQVAIKLTDLECHRTDTEYEDSFTFKMFLFQFINFYGSIFYIAFFKGRFMSYPGSTRYYVFGRWKQDECDPAGCLIELCIQLFMVMLLKQGLNNAKELLLPVVKRSFLTAKAKKLEEQQKEEGNLFMRWEQDRRLTPLTNLALFDEYLEMVIQFGFVTIFVAAFPLAPFFALLNNIIEIRLDAYKFVTAYQRPVALKAQDIGAWYGILQGLSFIAVLSNSFIIGWTATFVPKMVYKFALSPNNTFHGYVDDSLSVFNVKDFINETRPDDFAADEFGNVTHCRYKDYRYPSGSEFEYDYTREYWLIFACRLGFVIVFEHVCFLFTWAVTVIVPDIPGNVKRLMLYEKQLTKKMTFDATFSEVHDEAAKKHDGLRQRQGPNVVHGANNNPYGNGINDPVYVY